MILRAQGLDVLGKCRADRLVEAAPACLVQPQIRLSGPLHSQEHARGSLLLS